MRTWILRKRNPKRPLPKLCENCERDLPLSWYGFVLRGIYLCDHCADLPACIIDKSVVKENNG